MSLTIKRKRGRPRLDEPKEINEFDLNLVEQFRKYPIFYDRNHPEHRNRSATERAWQRIAQNLSVSTNLVKQRMLQLRNRFTLEKRRVEALQQQMHDDSLTSPWLLYKYLTFLSDYVKTRRPYSLTPSNTNTKLENSMISSELEEEAVDDNFRSYGNHLIVNNRLKDVPNFKQFKEHKRRYSSSNQEDSSNIPKSNYNLLTCNTVQSVKDSGQEKFRAFGHFLASSLMEMQETKALELIEKFTNDLVVSLKREQRTHNERRHCSQVTNDSDSSQMESDR